jgi:hypothetical protein
MQNAGDHERIVHSIRANIVFEMMIVSVLTVAVAAGAIHFAINIAQRAAAGLLSFAGLANDLIAAVSYAVLFFLAGFAAGLVAGVPLFRFLERAKFRKIWPFVLGAAAIGVVILSAAGAAPSFDSPWRIAHLAPGVAAAWLFGRKLRPLWAAAERAEIEVPQISRLN